jgi:transcription initiation factor TFIIIB Brf1 subunit/transcription initiation factor TFIIB
MTKIKQFVDDWRGKKRKRTIAQAARILSVAETTLRNAYKSQRAGSTALLSLTEILAASDADTREELIKKLEEKAD